MRLARKRTGSNHLFSEWLWCHC